MAETGNPIGSAKCPLCGGLVMIRENKKGHLYINCALPESGGCGSQIQSRTPTCDHLLSKHVAVWRCTQKRRDELSVPLPNMPPVPEPDDDPEPDELPDDPPAPVPARVPPLPRSPAPPQPARRAAPATKPKNFWDTEL